MVVKQKVACNEELRSLHSSLNECGRIKNDEMGDTYSKQGEMINACKRLIGKAERKRHFGRHGHRRVDNIEMELKVGMRVWAGYISLKEHISGWLLWTQ
jgi:predicted RNA-binding protein YlqC (UPF0109 family)